MSYKSSRQYNQENVQFAVNSFKNFGTLLHSFQCLLVHVGRFDSVHLWEKMRAKSVDWMNREVGEIPSAYLSSQSHLTTRDTFELLLVYLFLP